ncbi:MULTISPECIES: hypothetical protein [unclassified Methylobacterium]|jgi:hypothetical protein|uniref:hypothetical protein n=1 Tax=unclassified Methylobacterium TaxID=2615210 RepID=UPI0006F2F493|nr:MULTISPECIES: hypothetical protein [unclassified Methylobacterium]KQO65409.1 hypothetical protein ASF20_05620 [Methylobacterium sp. Leaf88]KQO67944.1 hypothetical protein ASF18_05565 [Methylobacterium sp. Leaf89]KQP67476.1 hypothetical protein ASF41_06745 [Methylobacterium sp. Leaf111]KQT73715.1 hypothetical protein ASG51_09695 [Methylobacterium sp. Leaf465]
MRRLAAIALSAALLAPSAGRGQAQPAGETGASPPADPAACTQFDWSLLREQAWFSAASLPRVESGGTLPAAMPAAILALKPQEAVAPPVAPSRAPKPGSYGGVLHLAAPLAPGAYQVTLSDRAWIDVSQDDRTTRPPTASTMRPGCPMLAKSVRFQLGTAPITLLVSGAPADTIRIAVAPVE